MWLNNTSLGMIARMNVLSNFLFRLCLPGRNAQSYRNLCKPGQALKWPLLVLLGMQLKEQRGLWKQENLRRYPGKLGGSLPVLSSVLLHLWSCTSTCAVGIKIGCSQTPSHVLTWHEDQLDFQIKISCYKCFMWKQMKYLDALREISWC